MFADDFQPTVRRSLLSSLIDPINKQLSAVSGLVLDGIGCEKAYRQLFSGVTVSLRAGQGLHVAGSNGSGKTTLLKIIAGLSSDYHGSIGWRYSDELNHVIDKSDLLYLGHLTGVKSLLTPLENLSWWVSLCLPAYPIGSDEITRALQQIGLNSELNTPCHFLSAGQQRRVALARLLLSQQRVWILDEPFTALDHSGISQIENCIKRHQSSGGLVIMTSHQAVSNVELIHLNLADYQQRPN